MSVKASYHHCERPGDADAAAMDILAQLDRLRAAAEQAGETALAAQVAILFEGYVTRYCDSKRADLEESLRHHLQKPKDYLN